MQMSIGGMPVRSVNRWKQVIRLKVFCNYSDSACNPEARIAAAVIGSPVYMLQMTGQT